MPRMEPPDKCPGLPWKVSIKKGTKLFRIHLSAYDANTFNPTPATNPFKGGRFDHVDDDGESFAYAGENLTVAVAEVLMRDIPVSAAARYLPFSEVEGKLISTLEIASDLTVVGLYGKGLGRLGQDPWLTTCDSYEYPLTRWWAKSIRTWCPAEAGFKWMSRRFLANNAFAYVFYGTRVSKSNFVVKDSIPADDGEGFRKIKRILKDNNILINKR